MSDYTKEIEELCAKLTRVENTLTIMAEHHSLDLPYDTHYKIMAAEMCSARFAIKQIHSALLYKTDDHPGHTVEHVAAILAASGMPEEKTMQAT